MINNDTIELLKECNAGIKMGVTAIEEVLDKVNSDGFKKLLRQSLEEHQRLGSETHALLNKYRTDGKEPNIAAKGMSWLKTNIMMSVKKDDATIADFITDGCNMGVKSLNKYLNEYKAAEEKAKDIAKKLINAEAQLTIDIREYL